MNWLLKTFSSSIGKKLLMALTGLSFCGFLVAHLIGNLTIYGGKDLFNAYAEHLHALGPVITVAEIVLLSLFIIHVLIGLTLFFQNLGARSKRYAVNKSAGGSSIGSKTMPYTGILILGFIVLHLLNFHFVEKTDVNTIADIVSRYFTNPVFKWTYVAAIVVVAIHVSHGFWSAFQTFGANHPKYMPTIKTLGLLFSFIVAVGFGFLPILIKF